MDFGHWVVYGFVALVIVLMILRMLSGIWLRSHPELVARVVLPPEFLVDIRRVQRLEDQRQQDPQVIILLIQAYERILERLQPDKYPLFYASIQNNLGVAYSQLPTGDRTTNLERAIVCFREALRFRTPEATPLEYAATQSNLGTAYGQLPIGDPATNRAQEIMCYQEALRYQTPETAPLEYPRTQVNLGNAYLGLPSGVRADNIAQAIICYQEALRYQMPENASLEYALIQNALGNAYRNLLTGDRAAKLARAIVRYEEALRFWTPETAPLDYALVQSNLGTVYSQLPMGDRTANVAQAIKCYQEALRFRTPETAPFEYARTQAALGAVYSDHPTGDSATNLAQAIACYQEALRFLTPETAPFEYARVQNNLGKAYSQLPTGDSATNLAQAIACYQEALRFLTPETAPFEYAMTQNNLGIAYSQLPTGDRTANAAQAIKCYQEALRFRTPETMPSECRGTNRNLADLYFAQGEWKAALAAYRAAMDAGERLYRAGLSTESKATEVAENTALYRHAAFTAVRCGEAVEALLILERGKTRLLAEALHLRAPRPTNVPDEVWIAFEHAGAVIRAAQSQGTAISDGGHDPVQTYTAHEQAIHTANATLDAAIERVRVHAPDFLQGTDLATTQALLPDERTVLVAFCITEQGSLAFVVYHNHDQEVQVVEVPNLTQTKLRQLLVELDTNKRAVGGWLVDYDRVLSEFSELHQVSKATFDAWQATITSTLTELGQLLLAPVLLALPPNVERIIFLSSAELFLLPLHAVPLTSNGSDLVCDRYQVSYAPSIEVLANIRAKAVRVTTPELYAVVNPEVDPRFPPLIFSPIEGATIAELFAKRDVDEGRDGTKQRVIAGVRGRTYVHFSCHGRYDWNDPPASGLALASHSYLTLADLQLGEIDLSAARLVTLSACETGIIDVLQGSPEEYVGIPAGFLLAGVPCVVSSLWAVLDISTALLMVQFYRNHLSSGMDFAAALREAQLWVRELRVGEVSEYVERCYRQSRQRDKDKKKLFEYMHHYRYLAKQNPTLHPFEHPYYWAAFTVNGM